MRDHHLASISSIQYRLGLEALPWCGPGPESQPFPFPQPEPEVVEPGLGRWKASSTSISPSSESLWSFSLLITPNHHPGILSILVATCPAAFAVAAQARSQLPSWRLPPTALTAVLSLGCAQRGIINKVSDPITTQSERVWKRGIIESLVERLYPSISFGAWLRQPTLSLAASSRPKPAPAGLPPTINQQSTPRPVGRFARYLQLYNIQRKKNRKIKQAS